MDFISLESEKKYLEDQVKANEKRASKKNAGNLVGFILLFVFASLIILLGALCDFLVAGIILGAISLGFSIFFWCQGFLNSLAKQRFRKYKDRLDIINKNIEFEKNVESNNIKVGSVDDLLKYKQLLDAGVISQAEFEVKKKEFLNRK